MSNGRCVRCGSRRIAIGQRGGGYEAPGQSVRGPQPSAARNHAVLSTLRLVSIHTVGSNARCNSAVLSSKRSANRANRPTLEWAGDRGNGHRPTNGTPARGPCTVRCWRTPGCGNASRHWRKVPCALITVHSTLSSCQVGPRGDVAGCRGRHAAHASLACFPPDGGRHDSCAPERN